VWSFKGGLGEVCMNILVTGAAGYIGNIVTEELMREGFSVVGLQIGYRSREEHTSDTGYLSYSCS